MLAPATPCSSQLTGAPLAQAVAHTGLSPALLASTHHVVSLGELKLVCGGAMREEDEESSTLGLAEFIREHPSLVKGCRVLNFASAYGGALGIAAAESGAALVVLQHERDDVVSLLHTNAALNAAWTTGCVVHVANVDDGPSVLRDAYTPELCLISDATLSSSFASTLTALLLRGEGREEILLAHTLCHGTPHEGGGVDGPLVTFLTTMAASHWTWTASRLHKTEHIYSVADRGTQPRKESISSPYCGPSDVSLLPCGVLPLLPEGVMGGTAVPPPTSSAAATTTQPSSPRTLLSEHVEALPLDTEMGPGECSEALHGAAIKPTPEECAWLLHESTGAPPPLRVTAPPCPATATAASPLLATMGQEVTRVAGVPAGTIVLLHFRRGGEW